MPYLRTCRTVSSLIYLIITTSTIVMVHVEIFISSTPSRLLQTTVLTQTGYVRRLAFNICLYLPLLLPRSTSKDSYSTPSSLLHRILSLVNQLLHNAILSHVSYSLSSALPRTLPACLLPNQVYAPCPGSRPQLPAPHLCLEFRAPRAT